MTIIIGKIRELDLEKRCGRIHASSMDRSTGEKVIEFQYANSPYPANDVKRAFNYDTRVVIAIGEKGFLDYIAAVVEVKDAE